MTSYQKIKEKLRDKGDEADDGEFFLLRNPKSRRIAHIMEPLSTKSACGSFQPVSAVDGKIDELSEIKTKDEVEDYTPTCKNCLNEVNL